MASEPPCIEGQLVQNRAGSPSPALRRSSKPPPCCPEGPRFLRASGSLVDSLQPSCSRWNMIFATTLICSLYIYIYIYTPDSIYLVWLIAYGEPRGSKSTKKDYLAQTKLRSPYMQKSKVLVMLVLGPFGILIFERALVYAVYTPDSIYLSMVALGP